MLETLNIWNGTWRVPACDPVQYMSELGYLLKASCSFTAFI